MTTREYLERVDALRKSNAVAKPGRRHVSFESLVLAEGREWVVDRALRRTARLGLIGLCFMNAIHAAESDPNLTYCEGWASYHIPVHHAWCVDRIGRVVEVTWRRETGVLWSERTYVGVPFDMHYIYKIQLKSRCYGVFYGVDDALRDDPREFLDERWRDIILNPKNRKREETP